MGLASWSYLDFLSDTPEAETGHGAVESLDMTVLFVGIAVVHLVAWLCMARTGSLAWLWVVLWLGFPGWLSVPQAWVAWRAWQEGKNLRADRRQQQADASAAEDLQSGAEPDI